MPRPKTVTFFADGSTRPLPQDRDPHQDHLPGEEGEWFTMREQDVPALREKLGMGADGPRKGSTAPSTSSNENDTVTMLGRERRLLAPAMLMPPPLNLMLAGATPALNAMLQREGQTTEYPEGLSWKQSLGHFYSGSGKAVTIPFHSIDPGYDAQDFPEFGTALQNAPVALDIQIDAKKGYDTNGPIGRGVARLQGTLHKNADGTYDFKGGVRSFDGFWNADKRPDGERDGKGRIPLKERATDLLRWTGNYMNAKPYPVQIQGTRPVQANGKWK